MPMHHPCSAYATLDEWVAAEVIPFATDEPASFSSAADRLMASLDVSPELLGFGEALHGGEEILLLRNRLFERLVEAHGFRAIAIESSFIWGREANEYAAGCGPASYEELQDTGFSHGFGRLEANRELLEWMREYNADPAHAVKLRFYGCDFPAVAVAPANPGVALQFVLDYFAPMDGACAREHREHIEPYLGEDARWANPMAWRDPVQSPDLLTAADALRLATEDLLCELRTRRPQWVAGSDADRYLEALQYALNGRELLNFFVALGREGFSASLGVRDALMADNLAYIVERERGRGKVLVFAHNMHLQRGKARMEAGGEVMEWWPAGSLLNEMLGPDYAVIGSAVGISEANGIGKPEAGTLEARLMAAPALFFPTHRGKGLPPTDLPTRSGSARNPSYFPLTARSLADYDGLAFLRSATCARGGRPLP